MADSGIPIKEPPHSDEAELAVLGGIYLRNNALDEISDQLKEEDFYRSAHRHVYAAMRSLHNQRKPIDPITLAEELNASGQWEAVGGLEFLAKLGEETLTSANIVHHAKIVSDKALLRRLIVASNNILSQAYSPSEDISEVLDSAMAGVLDVARDKAHEGVVALDQIIHETIRQLGVIAQTGMTTTGVSTGFYDLDNITHGFQKGDLIILASRPGMGKTSFALNCAAYAASKAGGSKKTLVFSMEMPRAQLGQRLLCSEAGINLSALRSAQLIEINYESLIHAAGALYDTKMFIDDTGNLSVMDIRAKARRLQVEQGGLDMIVIDYIQLMRTQKSAQSREQEISQISRTLKILAKELDIPILALAQLNRMVEQRPDKRPRPSDLRESGALEQDADLILFIYRDIIYEPDTPEPDVAEIILGKHRNGPTGVVKLKFEGQFTRFQNRSEREDLEDIGF